MLDLLHADFIQLMARFDEPYRRYLHGDFVRAERLSGVLGPRGVGKTTFLLQLIGETPDFLRSTLYVSLDSIHASGNQLYACVFRPIVTAHSEKGVTGDSEVVTGDSDLIVTDLGRRRNHRSRCRNRRSRSNRNGLCGQRGNHPCHGYPRALCAERRDAGGADCHAQHQGAVTAQVRLRALA